MKYYNIIIKKEFPISIVTITNMKQKENLWNVISDILSTFMYIYNLKKTLCNKPIFLKKIRLSFSI